MMSKSDALIITELDSYVSELSSVVSILNEPKNIHSIFIRGTTKDFDAKINNSLLLTDIAKILEENLEYLLLSEPTLSKELKYHRQYIRYLGVTELLDYLKELNPNLSENQLLVPIAEILHLAQIPISKNDSELNDTKYQTMRKILKAEKFDN